MTNYLDSLGLHTEELATITAELTTGMKAIYGQDINLDPNSPDAQMLNIFAQAKIDMLGALAQVWNSMSPERAVGVSLDQRCALNGVVRRGATYTRTYVTVTTDRILTLPGLDTSTTPFSVADAGGNVFYLEETAALASGANTLAFRAAEAGLVATTVGTITTIVSITLGVLSVTNGTSAITTGQNEETDVQLRARRQASVSLPSEGYLTGLIGALLSVPNVLDAVAYENVGSATDTKGVPGHSIWCIVDGGTDALVADAIYRKRNAGCGMKGSEIVQVSQVDGTTFPIKFDRPTYQDLYVSMTLVTIDPLHAIDADYLKAQIFAAITYKINQPADFTAITTLVKELDPLAVVDHGGVSDTAGSYVPFIYPATIQARWLMSTTRIAITV